MDEFVYWEDGFYTDQNEQGTRTQITRERHEELLNLSSQGYDIYTDSQGYPQAREHIADPKAVAERKVQLNTMNLESTDYIPIKLAEACTDYILAQIELETAYSTSAVDKRNKAIENIKQLKQKYKYDLANRQTLREQTDRLKTLITE